MVGHILVLYRRNILGQDRDARAQETRATTSVRQLRLCYIEWYEKVPSHIGKKIVDHDVCQV